MCSCKGLLPQSSPSHLIHKEMTGITIPQQKMLWGSQCITSFFTFAPRSNSFTLDSKILKMNQGISAPGLAPLLTCFDLDKLFSLSLRFLIYKMDNSYLVSWGRRPPDSVRGDEACHGVSPRGPLACPACEAPPRSREGGCAPARVRPVALSSASSLHYIILSSEGWVGAGSLGGEETFATFLRPFSSTPRLTHTVQAASRKQRRKERRTWGGDGGGREGSAGGGEVRISA